MNNSLDNTDSLDITAIPEEKVHKSGISKLLEFFKKSKPSEPDIQQIETPIEEDPYTKQNEIEDDNDDNHESHDHDDDDDDDDQDDDDDNDDD